MELICMLETIFVLPVPSNGAASVAIVDQAIELKATINLFIVRLSSA